MLPLYCSLNPVAFPANSEDALKLPDNFKSPFGFKCIAEDDISILSPEPDIYDPILVPIKKLDALIIMFPAVYCNLNPLAFPASNEDALKLPDNFKSPFGFKCIADDEISILSPEPEIYCFVQSPTKKVDALAYNPLLSNDKILVPPVYPSIPLDDNIVPVNDGADAQSPIYIPFAGTKIGLDTFRTNNPLPLIATTGFCIVPPNPPRDAHVE